MTQSQNQQMESSPLDEPTVREEILSLIRSGWTNRSIAKTLSDVHDLETSEASIRRFRKRHGINPTPTETEKAYTKIVGNTAEASSPVSHSRPVLDDPDAMLRDRGLDPEEWFIDADRG